MRLTQRGGADRRPAAPARATRFIWAARAGGWPSRIGMLVLVVVVLAFFVGPVATLIAGAFRTAPPGQPGHWSISGFTRAYTDPSFGGALRNSAVLSVCVTVLSAGIALFFCWVVTRTDTWLRRLVTPMMALVFAMPQLYFAISWNMAGNKNVGLVNEALQTVLGIGSHPVNINSWWGLIFVMTLKVVASTYILLLGPASALNRTLEEASLLSGAGKVRTFLRIDLRILAPAVTGLMILGFVIGLGSLDTALVIGVPAHIDVFGTQIYDYLNNDMSPSYAPATSLSLLLVVVILVLVWVQRRALGRRNFATVTGKAYRQDPWRIGRWRYLCTAAIVVYAVLALLLPLSQLVIGSLQPVFGLYSHYTFANYRTMFTQEQGLGSAFVSTFLIAVVGGFLAMAFAVVLTNVARRRPGRLTRAISAATWLPWALPGIVLSLAMLWADLTAPGLRTLYGSNWILLIALAVMATPIAARTMEGAVAQLSPELEESARASGAGPARALGGIVVRLTMPSFLAGWFVSGIIIAGSFDVPVLLSTSTNPIIPVVVYQLYTNGQASMASAVFCLMLAIIAVGYCVLLLAGRLTTALVNRQRLAALTRDLAASGELSFTGETTGA